MRKNIVITGEGIVSAIGTDKASVLSALQRGQTGIGTMTHLRSSHREIPVAEVVFSNDDMKRQLGIAPSEPTSRTALMGMLAIGQALTDAHIDGTTPPGQRIVLVSGTTVGGMDQTELVYSSLKHSDAHLNCLADHDCGSSTRRMADHFGLFTDHTTLSTACSSAANALILGARLIEQDLADIVVAGGSEALSLFHLNGFNSLMIIDSAPCRPFDAHRGGLTLGEGAAFVVLESEAAARHRQADIHAYLTGYGNACDAFHQTASSANGEGACRAMQEALAMAGCRPDEVDYVNAHGTGTPNNDLTESVALSRVFGPALPLVSSTKGFTGHTTSASGGIEAVICLLALAHDFVPGNIGWQTPMPDGIVPTKGVAHKTLKTVLCNSFGFGGNDSSLLFEKAPRTASGTACSLAPSNAWGEPRIAARAEVKSEADLAEIRAFVSPLEARRMGRLLKASLLTSLKALREAGIERPDAIITGTAMGCLENSEQLLDQLESEGEVMLKPTLFMQSTHNTIGSNIAIRTQCHGYNVTYTQGERSLEWALRDAQMLLRSGKCRHVLVGLHDESTALFRNLQKRLGRDESPALHSISMVLTC